MDDGYLNGRSPSIIRIFSDSSRTNIRQASHGGPLPGNNEKDIPVSEVLPEGPESTGRLCRPAGVQSPFCSRPVGRGWRPGKKAHAQVRRGGKGSTVLTGERFEGWPPSTPGRWEGEPVRSSPAEIPSSPGTAGRRAREGPGRAP